MSAGRRSGVREGNLADLLRLVHVHGPLSRAELTARTGLNRSTIGSLVTVLSQAGLVGEHEPDPTRRVGRPSPMVTADPRVVALAVNPEVDAITVGVVGLDRRVRVRTRVACPQAPTPEQAARVVAATMADWSSGPLSGLRPVGIGVAVPGAVRRTDGLVRSAPHLRWKDAAVRPLMERACGLPTVIGNDANMGAVAEHLFGAAREAEDLVYLNGGASGIGGAVVVGGVLIGGVGGYAGEFGQSPAAIVRAQDRTVPGGVLEDEVNRRRLVEALAVDAADDEALARALAAQTAGHEEIQRQRRVLATALAHAVNALNPAMVVLGGFLAMLAEVDLEELSDQVRGQCVAGAAEALSVRTAGLADDRLLIGAAEAAFAPLLSDPLTARRAGGN